VSVGGTASAIEGADAAAPAGAARAAGAAQTAAAAAIALCGGAALLATFAAPALSAAAAGALALAASGAALFATAAPAGRERAWFAGVAARLPTPGARAGARALVLATAPLAGLGVALYAAAALRAMVSDRDAERPAIEWRTSLATGLVGLAALAGAAAAGLTVGEAVLWPVAAISAGLPLFWGAGALDAEGDDDIVTLLGVTLLVLAAGLILDELASFVWDEETIAGMAGLLLLAALVIVPRRRRAARALAAERRLRAREQERAEIGDMLHDSVLQTLALIQRQPDVPDRVAGLARRQERELRDWLLRGERLGRGATTLDAALRDVVAEVEDHHGVSIEAIVVGDAPLGRRVQDLVAATREALINAAVHGGGAPISMFAKAERERIEVYVHDRGPGFDLERIAPERRGVRDSIIGRMERIGGEAVIRTAPGRGCEVVLSLVVPR
jgi:signal transduction histidine kinase